MGRLELGTKRICTGCRERFYDLNRAPAICPKCGVQQSPEKPRVPRPHRGSFGAGSKPQQAPNPVTANDDGEPAGAPEMETEGDEPEADDEVDDDLEIDPDIAKTAE